MNVGDIWEASMELNEEQVDQLVKVFKRMSEILSELWDMAKKIFSDIYAKLNTDNPYLIKHIHIAQYSKKKRIRKKYCKRVIRI